MVRPAATPSEARAEDRRMQPNRAAMSFVPGQRSKFSNPSDLRGLALAAGVFSSLISVSRRTPRSSRLHFLPSK